MALRFAVVCRMGRVLCSVSDRWEHGNEEQNGGCIRSLPVYLRCTLLYLPFDRAVSKPYKRAPEKRGNIVRNKVPTDAFVDSAQYISRSFIFGIAKPFLLSASLLVADWLRRADPCSSRHPGSRFPYTGCTCSQSS